MSAARGTSPAFMLYASDLMAGKSYRLMTLAERGLLLSMWCECWANSEIPGSPEELAAWLGKPNEVIDALTPKVVEFFERSPSGAFRSPDLEAYRENVIQKRKQMSEGGQKGGRKRAENEKRSREATSPPSVSNQAPLKPHEHELEIERELEPQSLGEGINKDPFVVEYEAEQAREYARVKDGD